MADAPKFEEGLAALEKLVAELEEGDLGLDEALKRFEKGVHLAAQMQGSLEETGRKIDKLTAQGLQKAAAPGEDSEDAATEGAAEEAPRKAGRRKPVDPTLF